MLQLILRIMAYALMASALAQLALFEAVTLGTYEKFTELGFIELSHTTLLTLCALILAYAAWRYPEWRVLAGVMSMAFAGLMIRENDQILELWLPHGFWKWPVSILAAGIVWVFIRHREALMQQARRIAHTLPMGILIAGFTTMAFSRFFGRTSFWQAVMEDRYFRVVKTAAEESTELFGIGLLTASVIELFLVFRKWQTQSQDQGL